MCWRADVGLGDIRHTDSAVAITVQILSSSNTQSQGSSETAAHRSGTVKEWCEGAVDVASEPLLITTAAPSTG